MDKNIVDQFTGVGSKAILMQFSRQESILLQADKGITVKADEKRKRIDFVMRHEFDCYIFDDAFLSPFEMINLLFTTTLQTVSLDPKDNNGNRIDVKFNCMTSDSAVLISHA